MLTNYGREEATKENADYLISRTKRLICDACVDTMEAYDLISDLLMLEDFKMTKGAY